MLYSVESDEGKKSEEIVSFLGISKEILQSNSKVEKNLYVKYPRIISGIYFIAVSGEKNTTTQTSKTY